MIKVYELNRYFVTHGNTSSAHADYLYCVKIFGHIVHSVTITQIPVGAEKYIFGNKKIIKTL